jgi:hypothetical protein
MRVHITAMDITEKALLHAATLHAATCHFAILVSQERNTSEQSKPRTSIV